MAGGTRNGISYNEAPLVPTALLCPGYITLFGDTHALLWYLQSVTLWKQHNLALILINSMIVDVS